jgi:hypothetical protein
VLGGGASRPRRDRLLLNTITVVKAKGRRAGRRGPLGSR